MLEFIFVQFKCGVSNKGIDPALLKVQPGPLDGFTISLEFLMC